MKPIYTILFSLILVACENSEKKSDTPEAVELDSNEIAVSTSQFEGEQMQLGKLTPHAFNQLVRANGMIDVPPQNKAIISTFMGGYITKTPLLVGDKVNKGQLLVTLENTEFVEIQQQYLEVAEQLNYLKSEYERQQTLFDENITSQKNFLKAESSYKSSLAQYNGLQKKLNMMNINPSSVEQGQITSKISLYATIEGFITKVNVNNGTYVSPADVILEIVDTAHIHLELSVFEKDILNIKKEQKITFKIPEASNKTFDAKVHLVGTTVDGTNRTVKVHGHIEDEKRANFIVGMFIEAEIITDSKSSLALPKDAVVEVDGNHFVLVLNQKTENYLFDKVKLELGQQTEDFVEVLNTSDIKDKDVLVKGAFMAMAE
ncbi:efflux RND transporter periplasmic adaptor subunit [Subsaximicrobium wynnwilliamsii]|uniref:Efflux RND transporter periplasmic adaptor subunit n=1 Tax=Subsaximicrobium wynnwilliamsii TaxID=291179 RepID=A0A5C6ZK06_9FLAO|nr:efflux RND transporter periplasmic adaptor subunit [Subsaximicrobium wynnwilliamsii]TXD84441.1 efflux RND transporter periplasmic adaptor subunit [Subsaximicrobium wynnwilliamsii]TXD90122.1 efflux RND transporter periplasmic adaptor subunit [Subsaximicrobium wynnwilliamsii]TXE04174.1 efflux RND transporter periplasmic adaptor subunit [Subsaximicrobium wynnwilliamsii]